jgi:uncharacterized membrane protein
MKQWLNEKYTYLIFKISLFLKGGFAILEILGGVLFLLLTKNFITNFVWSITADELSEDPNDFIAQHLIGIANQMSLSSQHFLALYLLGHGVVKIVLIIGLLKNKLWAYPASLVIFTLFIVYQIYRYYFTHSAWLLALTILDLVIIGLVWHEYKYLKAKQPAN